MSTSNIYSVGFASQKTVAVLRVRPRIFVRFRLPAASLSFASSLETSEIQYFRLIALIGTVTQTTFRDVPSSLIHVR